jgi:hypothetical protein
MPVAKDLKQPTGARGINPARKMALEQSLTIECLAPEC